MGEGWGEGIPRISAIFPNTLTAQIQALRLVALSLALSHGRGDGRLLGLRFAVMETNGAGCFFRRPFMGWIQAACKRFLIFQLFLFVAVYTILTACCPLSNSLPRE